ncbi:hypothetical protein BGX28_009207 [Mortierella sp. GBA30]|nr:hypothetical protein BGX28_009207 [Mortierella sp. GBA30]
MTEKNPIIHTASHPRVGCITLSIGNVLFLVNRVQVTGLPQEFIDPIRQCITSTLGPIQKELGDFGAHDFRFQGGFQTMLNQTEERAKSRKLTLELFKCMLKHGWTFIQATPTMDELFVVGFNNKGRVRIIEASTAIALLVREAILKHWDGEAGILDASVGTDDSVEFQLKATPFMDFSVENSVKVQLLMSQIIANIKTANYKLYAMIDSSGVHSNPDLATWEPQSSYCQFSQDVMASIINNQGVSQETEEYVIFSVSEATEEAEFALLTFLGRLSSPNEATFADAAVGESQLVGVLQEGPGNIENYSVPIVPVAPLPVQKAFVYPISATSINQSKEGNLEVLMTVTGTVLCLPALFDGGKKIIISGDLLTINKVLFNSEKMIAFRTPQKSSHSTHPQE